MTRTTRDTPSSARLPELLRPLFWEYRFGDLSWEEDTDLITARILSVGSMPALGWLRRRSGDAALRDWIIHRKGRGLSPPQLRYWELILGIPRRRVNAWLADERRRIWDRRRAR